MIDSPVTLTTKTNGRSKPKNATDSPFLLLAHASEKEGGPIGEVIADSPRTSSLFREYIFPEPGPELKKVTP